MTSNKKDKQSDWELEAPFDLAATLDELISDSPFKQASDESGQSTTAGARIPSWLQRRIVKIKELSGSPYELNSDVIRDALYIGMRVLHLRYRMTKDWEVETKMAAAVDATAFSRRIREQVDLLVDGIDEMFRDGDADKAAQNLRNYVLAVVELENTWQRDKIFKTLGESKAIRDLLPYCPKDVQMILEKELKK